MMHELGTEGSEGSEDAMFLYAISVLLVVYLVHVHFSESESTPKHPKCTLTTL